MHETALCAAIARSAVEHAGGRPVRRVSVRIGHLRQVVPDTLAFCWGLCTEGTELDGAELDVTHLPAVIRCRACGAETTLEDPFLLCGHCDGADVEVVQGEELLVESIDVARGAA